MGFNYYDWVKDNCKIDQSKEMMDGGLVTDLVTDLIDQCSLYAQTKQPENLAHGYSAAVSRLEDYYTMAFLSLYGIPTTPLEDLPEKWIDVPDHPRIGKIVKVSRTRAVKIESVQRHADTPEGSICEIIRFNGNSDTANMPFGTIMYVFDHIGDENPTRRIGISAFIDAFPYRVALPVIAEIYNDRPGLALVSDITRRFAFVSTNIQEQSYSPHGTKLFPAKQIEGAFVDTEEDEAGYPAEDSAPTEEAQSEHIKVSEEDQTPAEE